MVPSAPATLDGGFCIAPRHAPRPDAISAGLIGLGLYETAAGFLSGLERPPRARHASTSDDSGVLQQATVELSLGLASLAAVRRRSWRAPILALGSLSWLLRAIARGAGVPGYGTPGRSEAFGRALPAAAAAWLAWLFSRATRAERWEAG